jgi:hypothetical protein
MIAPHAAEGGVLSVSWEKPELRSDGTVLTHALQGVAHNEWSPVFTLTNTCSNWRLELRRLQ